MNINTNIVIEALKDYTHDDLDFISEIQQIILNTTIVGIKNYPLNMNNDILFLSCCIIYDLFYKKSKEMYYLYSVDDIEKYYHHRNDLILLFDNNQENIVKYFVEKYCKEKELLNSVEFGDHYIKRISSTG